MRRSTSAPSLHQEGKVGKGGALLIACAIPRSKSNQVIVAHALSPIVDLLLSSGGAGKGWHMEDLEAAMPFVPVQQALICGSTHSFPLSLLDPGDEHDARSVATCLATPSVPEPEERVDASNVLRRIVHLDAVYRKRVLMHRLRSEGNARG